MKTTHLINRLEQVYSGDPWYGSCIADILNQQFVDPNFSIGNGNSIGQIVEHMIAWRHFTMEKLKGNGEYDITSTTDWQKGKTYSTSDFSRLAEDFKTSHKELITLLSRQSSDEWLANEVPGRKYNFEYLMEGILEHDIYHLRQISLLKSGSEK